MANHAQFYRPDIDGLRAIAVLPVVLFHAGIQGFSGGFIGVDIFFVISGYLITNLLLQELDQQRFSLLNFYARRIRRILPALLVVVATSLIAGFFLLSPQQYVALGLAARAVMSISANLHFAQVRADYWDQSQLAAQPLLHTWSLAVEEQFYLGLPVLLWILHTVTSGNGIVTSQRWPTLCICLAVLTVASFLWAERLLGSRPGDAFFLVTARAWELLAGSLLALRERTHPAPAKSSRRDIAGAAGLALLVASILLLNENMAFPGALALPPCLAAILIIYSGGCRAGMVRRLLAWRPIVFIGLTSYSLYLWHWPVLVFFRSAGWHGRMLMEIPIWFQLILIMSLAWLSWRYVEQPFRRRSTGARIKGWRTLLVGSCVATLTWISATLSVATGEGRGPFPQVLPPAVVVLDKDLRMTPGLRCEGSSDSAQITMDGGGCKVGANDRPLDFALLGDSHARMYTEAVDRLEKARGKSALIMARSSCIPALGLAPPTRKECKELTRASVEYLIRAPVSKVVLAGYWVDLANSDAEAATLYNTLKATVTALVASGKHVYLMKDVPLLPDDSYAERAALRSLREHGATIFGPTIVQHIERQRRITMMLERIATEQGAMLLDPASLLCDEKACKVAAQNRPLYRDKHHLTDFAASELRELFAPVATDNCRK